MLSQMRKQQMRKRHFIEIEADSCNEDSYSEAVRKRWVNEKQRQDDTSSLKIISTESNDEFVFKDMYCSIIEGVVIHNRYICHCNKK